MLNNDKQVPRIAPTSTAAVRQVAFAAAMAACGVPVHAIDIDTGSDVKVRWDNTVKYSIGARLSDPNSRTLGDANADESGRSFDKHALITNRAEILSEFDVRYQSLGFTMSAAAWYDNAYKGHTDNDNAGTFNPASVPVGEWQPGVRSLAGQHVELRNAFALARFNVGDAPVSVRLGRHTLLWGESLFFSDNGVAAGMAPVDAYTALGVPSIQAKEVFMPVGQLSATAVLPAGVTLEGYYQFEWRKTRIPPAGTFFSSTDILDDGGERLITGPGTYLTRGQDHHPKHAQFGASLRWRPENSSYDFGFHALQYSDKVPQFHILALTGQYALGYKEGIQLYGVSATTTVNSTNIGIETSYRRNVPLVSNPSLVLGGEIDNRNVLYALGDTFHYQASAIYAGKAGAFYDNVNIAGEIAGHHLVRVTKNQASQATTQDKNALGIRGVVTLQYFQVAPALDLDVPITLGHNFLGKSPITTAFNNYGSHHGGDVSIGVTGIYRTDWRAGISLTRFYGKQDENAYRDRSFVSATVQTAF